MRRFLGFQGAAALTVSIFISFGVTFAADAPSKGDDDVLKSMHRFCMDEELDPRELTPETKSKQAELFSRYPIEGYNPDLKEVEAYVEQLNEFIRGEARQPDDAFFFSVRGMLHIVLGNEYRALGDLSEALRVCPSAPMRTMLASVYRRIGLRDKAVQVADSIPCSRANNTLCGGKIMNFILLDEYGRAQSIMNQGFLESACVYETVIDLLKDGKVSQQCTFPQPGKDAGQRFIHELLTKGVSTVEYKQFYASTGVSDMVGYGRVYAGLYDFRRGKQRAACEEIKKALNIRATAKRLLYEYELAEKINREICSTL